MKKTKTKILKVAIFSDLHLQNQNKHYKTDTDGRGDLNRRQEQFIDHIASLDCDIVLNLGDSTDEEIVDPFVLATLNHLLLGPLSYKALVVHLEGNHCITDSGNVYSILSAYKDKISDNVRLTVDQANDIVLDVAGKSIYIRSVPYIGDYEAMLNMITKPLDTTYNDLSILVYHAPTVNALMDNGLPATKGLEFKPDDLDQFDLAIAGDFHRPQRFMVGDTPVYYCGAPFALTRGQNFRLGYRTLTVYDDGSYELEDHDNPYAIYIRDVEFGEEYPPHPERTVCYVNNVPHENKKDEIENLRRIGYYSYKVKTAPIERPKLEREDRKAQMKAHKTNDLRTLFWSVLTEEEKQDQWLTNLIDELSSNS